MKGILLEWTDTSTPKFLLPLSEMKHELPNSFMSNMMWILMMANQLRIWYMKGQIYITCLLVSLTIKHELICAWHSWCILYDMLSVFTESMMLSFLFKVKWFILIVSSLYLEMTSELLDFVLHLGLPKHWHVLKSQLT